MRVRITQAGMRVLDRRGRLLRQPKQRRWRLARRYRSSREAATISRWPPRTAAAAPGHERALALVVPHGPYRGEAITSPAVLGATPLDRFDRGGSCAWRSKVTWAARRWRCGDLAVGGRSSASTAWFVARERADRAAAAAAAGDL